MFARSASSLVLLAVVAACSSESDLAPQQEEPSIILSNPQAATWLSSGQIEAAGSYQALDAIMVNGVQAQVPGEGEFQAAVTIPRGITVMEAIGTDETGAEHYVRQSVIAGTFGDPDQWVDRAIHMRMNQAGLDAAMDYAAEYVDQQTVNDAAVSMNPVYEYSYDIWGWDAITMYVDIDEIAFATPEIVATPRSGGYLTLEVAIPDMFIDMQAWCDVVGWDFDVDVSMSVDRAVITVVTNIAAADGQLVLDVAAASAELEGFSYDLSALPSWVEDNLFQDSIRQTVEDLLVEQVEEQVPPLMEELLASLTEPYDLDVLGQTLTLSLSFDTADTDSEGIFMVADLRVTMPDSPGGSWEGYLVSQQGDPELNHDAPLVIALSDNLLNLAMFQAWRGGMLNMELSTEDGSLEPWMLTMVSAEEGSLAMDPQLPPVLVDDAGALELQVGELLIDLETPGGELGESLEMAVATFVDVELSVQDNSLSMDLGEPTLSMMVRDTDWGASNETTTALVEQMLPIDTLLGIIGGMSYDIPSLEGVGITSATASRDESGTYTLLDVELSFQ